MSAVLAVPALVVVATLVARRFGHATAGLLAGLPLTSGPLSVALALEHGPAYAAQAAVGSNVGIAAATATYGIYAAGARRLPWPADIALAILAFGALGVVLTRLPWTLSAATAAAVATALVVGRRLARDARPAAPLVELGLVPRALAAVGVVVGVSALARVAGPLLVGALTPLPVVVGVLVVFAQRTSGVDAALAVLRGGVRGSFAFAAFFLAVGAGLGHLSLVLVYAVASALALLVSAAMLRIR